MPQLDEPGEVVPLGRGLGEEPVDEPVHGQVVGRQPASRRWQPAHRSELGLERRAFPGGCCFATTSAEPGGHEGPVGQRRRELNAATVRDLVDQLRGAAGEIDPDADVEQRAFEIDSLVLGAHSAFLLLADPADLERARRAVRARLG